MVGNPFKKKDGGNKLLKNTAEEIQFTDSRGLQELSRIEQAIRRESSRYRELAAPWGSHEKAEDLVHRLLRAYEQLKNDMFELQKEIQSERQAKLDAQEWLRNKENLINRERASHHTQIRKIEADCERQLNNKEIEYSRQIAGLESKHADREHRLVKEYDAKIQHTQQVAEDLKQDLSTREHIKGLADREVALQFKKLSTDIEDFSRTEWDPRCEASWPYAEAELRSLRPNNVRKLKQQIVQNCLWLALHEHVFRSPFRIIGDYGRAFDHKMYEAHNPDYDTLGDAESAEFNMKRYENAKVFLAALVPSVAWSEKNPSIVQSYQQARTAVLDLICNAMTRVTTLDHEERDALDGMLQSAARLWLEVCSQRYRLFVIMPDESKDVLSLGRGDVNSLHLVIKPELQRFGNSSGTEMRQGESVTGWRSHVEVYPSSY